MDSKRKVTVANLDNLGGGHRQGEGARAFCKCWRPLPSVANPDGRRSSAIFPEGGVEDHWPLCFFLSCGCSSMLITSAAVISTNIRG